MGTPEEKVKQLREVFNEICESIGLTDDAIKKTYDECNAGWIERTKEMGVTTIQFEVLFDAIDLNNDGEISPEEWVKHNKALGINPVYAEASFKPMDTDGDGKVSKKEFVDYQVEFYYTAEDKLNSSILYGPLD